MKPLHGDAEHWFGECAKLIAGRDALAQRCRELESADSLFSQKQRQVEILSEWHANALNELCKVIGERDTIRATLTAARDKLGPAVRHEHPALIQQAAEDVLAMLEAAL